MKFKIITLLVFILAGCSTPDAKKKVFDIPMFIPDAIVSSPPVYEFEHTDAKDVDEAERVIKANTKKLDLIRKSGVARAKHFQPLFLKIGAFYDYDMNFVKKDIEPYSGSFRNIFVMLTFAEFAELGRIKQENQDSIKKLISEAKKGDENNKAHEELKADYEKLDLEIKNGSIKVAQFWAQWFFGGAVMCFVMVWVCKFAFGGLGNKGFTALGFLFMGCGAGLLIFTTAMQFFIDFLEKYGAFLVLLFAVPLIGGYLFNKLRKNN